jgi:translation initiation factor 5
LLQSFVSGHYSPEQLSELVSTFINKFVLCTTCRLPEWSYVPLKSGRVGLKCRACGCKSYVHQLDIQEKFIKFVQNKPPPKTAALDKNAAKGQEAVKAREKQDAKIMKQAEKLDVDIAEEEVEWGTDVSEAAMAARAAEMVPEKLKSIVANAAAPAADADAEEDEDVAAAAAGGDDDDDADADDAAAADEQDDADRVARLFETIGGNIADFGAAVKQHEAEIKAVVGAAQATRAPLFLKQWQTRVEALPEADRVPLKKRVPLVCKALYDADVVEEEHFLAWGQSGDAGALGKLAAPFLTWLAEAADDDDDDDDDEE